MVMTTLWRVESSFSSCPCADHLLLSPDPFSTLLCQFCAGPCKRYHLGPPLAILTLCLVDGEHQQVRKWERRNMVSGGAVALHSLFWIQRQHFPSSSCWVWGCCSQLVSGHLAHSPLFVCWTFTSWKQTFVKNLFIWYKWEWILLPIR